MISFGQFQFNYHSGSFFTKGFERDIPDFIQIYSDLRDIYQKNGMRMKLTLGYSHELEIKHNLFNGRTAISLTPGLYEYAIKSAMIFHNSFTPDGIRKNANGFELRKRSLSAVLALHLRLLQRKTYSLNIGLGYGYDLFIKGDRFIISFVGSNSVAYLGSGGGFSGFERTLIKEEFRMGNIRYRMQAISQFNYNLSKHMRLSGDFQYWYISRTFERYPNIWDNINGNAHCFGWKIGLGYEL